MRLTMLDRPRYYVSLGDSISIDAYAGGAGRGASSLLYKNREADFPEWLGKDLSTALPGSRVIPLAMDGGTSSTLRYVQIPRLREIAITPEIATVTIGGNDLMMVFGNDSATEAALQSLQADVRWSLAALRSLMGSDRAIVLGTIYDPSDGTGQAGELSLRAWPTALNWLHRFNETLAALAAERDCLLADIYARFQGHGATVGNPSQSDPRPENRDLWFCGTIEPNAWGASQVRALWWETLTAAGKLSSG